MMIKTTSDYIKIGQKSMKEGDIEEALRCFDIAIALDPKCGEAYYLKGFLNKNPDKLEEECELYRKAIAYGYKKKYLPYYCLAIALRKLNRLDESLEAYNKVLEVNPYHWQSYENKGIILMNQGKTQEAIQCYLQTIELVPDKVELYSMIGLLFEDLQDEKEAMRYYDLALSKDPENFKGNLFIGDLLLAQGKASAAVFYLLKALKQVENHPGACYSLGNAYKKLRMDEKAISYYLKAYEMKPKLSIEYCNRGQCFSILGKKREALEDFRKTQELLESDKKVNLAPNYIKSMKAALKAIFEVEDMIINDEIMAEKIDQGDEWAEKLWNVDKKLREERDRIQKQVIEDLHRSFAASSSKNLAELSRIHKELENSRAKFDRSLKEMKNGAGLKKPRHLKDIEIK